LSQWWRESRKQKSQLVSVRRLISLEVRHNLEILNDMKRVVMGEKEENEADAIIHRCQRFAGQPFPEFHDRVFVTQSPDLLPTLDEGTITSLFRHYDCINALRELRSKMQSTDAQQDQAWMMAGGGRSSVTIRPGESEPHMIFNKSCRFFWKKLDSLFNDLDSNGNPIK
jgi:hypothetical protein